MSSATQDYSLLKTIGWRVLVAAEGVAWFFAILPFFMCGGKGDLVVIGTQIVLPRLCL